MNHYPSLHLTRVDGTRFTYDVERNWIKPDHSFDMSRGSDWIWSARVVFCDYTKGVDVVRGGLNLGELSALRTAQRDILSRASYTVEL